VASTVIAPIGDALKEMIDALDVSQSVTGYLWPKGDLDSRPAGVVELPDLRRRGPDERESQLGANDWMHEFPVTFWIDNQGNKTNFPLLIDIVEAWVKAIDANPTLGLGGLIPNETSVTDVEPVITENEKLVGFQTTVAMTRLVSG
jgi:hypothetical protein